LLSALGSHDKVRARQVVVDQIRAMEDAITRALTASDSLLSANVAVEKPNNQFYLDVSPADISKHGDDHQPAVARSSAAPGVISKSRVGVKT
jgi:hypothetical protein